MVRLKNVINGDQTGISKSVGWKGGGDFVLSYKVDITEFDNNAKDFAELSLENQKRFYLSV